MDISGIKNGKLNTIAIDKYEPVPDKPHYVQCVGTMTYHEAFEQLKSHLKDLGMLPDEYFELSSHERNPLAHIPQDWREFICNTSFGGSEGIYLDISINTQSGTKCFATGKTLSEDTDSFLWMSRIAAECNLMLNGNGIQMTLPHDIREIIDNMQENNTETESDEMEM